MGKILIEQIRDNIYYLLLSRRLFLEEEKEFHKGLKGTGDLLCIDQHIVKERELKNKCEIV